MLVSRVLPDAVHGLPADLAGVAAAVDDAAARSRGAILTGAQQRVVERQHLRADAGEQKAVEPLVGEGLIHYALGPEMSHGDAQQRDDGLVPLPEVANNPGEGLQVRALLQQSQIPEGVRQRLVDLPQFGDRIPVRQCLDLLDPRGKVHRQLPMDQVGCQGGRRGLEDLRQLHGLRAHAREVFDLRMHELLQATLRQNDAAGMSPPRPQTGAATAAQPVCRPPHGGAGASDGRGTRGRK
mmetsp:Transcript_147804/g.375590  ORF Transcript_147804/g.375590 Transcript_147804/m.375590 type:complete len:239 (-) Transcript_147804:22-738(-)